jgi:hypothetical protein
VYLQGFGDPTTDITSTQLATFVQDEIRIGRNATFSAGLRYDTDWRDPSINAAGNTVPFQLHRSVTTDRNNVAPRVGASYAFGPQHQTVVRGGWGLFFQNPLTVLGFSSRVLSGQISQVFLPLTGLPGIPGTSADVWQQYQQNGRVNADTLKRLGITPGTTPAVLLVGRDDLPNAYSSQASVGVEREIADDLSIAAEYAYNRGYNIVRLRDINVRKIGSDQFTLPGLDPRFLQLNAFVVSRPQHVGPEALRSTVGTRGFLHVGPRARRRDRLHAGNRTSRSNRSRIGVGTIDLRPATSSRRKRGVSLPRTGEMVRQLEHRSDYHLRLRTSLQSAAWLRRQW